MRAASLDPAQVEPRLLGEALGQRLGQNAAAIRFLRGRWRRRGGRGQALRGLGGSGGGALASCFAAAGGGGAAIRALQRRSILALLQQQRDRRVYRHSLGTL